MFDEFDWNNAFDAATGIATRYVDYDIANRSGANAALYGPSSGASGATGVAGLSTTALLIGGVVIIGAVVAIFALKK